MWSSGTINGYTFKVKHFEEGSQFGIDEGRISKLAISKDDKTLVSYERGWDIEPAGEEITAVYQEILRRYN